MTFTFTFKSLFILIPTALKLIYSYCCSHQCEVIFNNDRNLTYNCVYVPTMPGQYRVTVSFAGREIPKSPFLVGVEAMSGDPTKVTASGPGIEKTGVVANRKTYFDVHSRSKYRPLRMSNVSEHRPKRFRVLCGLCALAVISFHNLYANCIHYKISSSLICL